MSDSITFTPLSTQAIQHCLAVPLFIYNRAVAQCTSWKFYIINSVLLFWCSSMVSAGPHSFLNKDFSCLPYCTIIY